MRRSYSRRSKRPSYNRGRKKGSRRRSGKAQFITVSRGGLRL